jgi:cell division septation protein DedD
VDTTLKQRLIGGAVLVALAVIFLPMLVQGPAPDSGVADVPTRVPDAPGGEYETRELPLLGAEPAATAAMPTPAVSAPAAAEASTPAATATQPDPAVAAGKWAVSFGAYSSARDAEAVLSRLRQAGLEGFSEQATISGRQAWRVRVGPYADRALAEAGRLQAVRIRNDVNAQVIALDAVAEGATGAATATAATSAPAPTASAAAASQAAATAPAPATRTEALSPEAAAAKPATPAATSRPTTTVQQPPPAATRPATPPPATAASAPVAPAASGVGFAVQMGAFASAADANALRDRLRAGGFSAIVQPVRTDKGTLSRVRVGPVASRAEAEQLKARLAGGFGSGMVVTHP